MKFISLLQHGSNLPKERVYKQYVVLYHARVKIGSKFLSAEKNWEFVGLDDATRKSGETLFYNLLCNSPKRIICEA